MTPEQRLWNRLRGNLGPGHFVRVENPIDPGTPDVNFATCQATGWLELKAPRRLPMTDKHGLRASQKLWISRRLRYQDDVLVAVGFKRLVYFVPGRYNTVINSWSLDDYQRFSSAFLKDPTGLDRAFNRSIRLFAGNLHLRLA